MTFITLRFAPAWPPAHCGWQPARPMRSISIRRTSFPPRRHRCRSGYFTYATRDSFTPTGGGELKQETGLDSFVSIFRYVHYMDVGGFTVAPQVLLPYGRLYNGSLNGVRLDSASGLGDPILAAPVWLVNNPSTTFAIVPYLYLPAGSYDAGRTLNVGENRWKFDLQLGACSSWVTVSPPNFPRT
ncbi:QbdB protein [Klebsiella aerogenes]|nr:QbdB protein [Klebsiella aerogenes]